MKVTVAAVMSADAKLTRGDETNIHTWVSKEDQTHLQTLIAEHDSIVFGSGTYKAMDGKFNLQPDKLRIVLTHKPERYADAEVPGQLEFMDASVIDFISMLEQRNKRKLLVAGGPQMIQDFMQAELVDELYLTIEPYIFGEGKQLLPNKPLKTQLRLISNKSLNEQRTTLLHYQVIR